MGGFVNVKSTLNLGTEFSINIKMKCLTNKTIAERKE
jgi:hypothetical protein